MTARDRTDRRVARAVTSCADCLAWGRTYAQGMCLACYNFANPRFAQHVGTCRACQRRVRLKQGYCRLCWCQARLDRGATATDPRARVVLAPYLSQVAHHQLFLADLYRPRVPARVLPRRYGQKGRPLKSPPPPASRPSPVGAQLCLLNDLPRRYRPGSVDLRAGNPPDNPWLTWALHLAATTAEARGFDPAVRRALNRNLVMLLATHADGDHVRSSDFHPVIRGHGGALVHVLDILAAMDVLREDRPAVFDTWLAAKLADLPDGIAGPAETWVRLLRDGGPRHRPRHPTTAIIYLNAVRPALLSWARTYHHLREITHDDVKAYLAPLHGERRQAALVALRSLLGWARRNGVIFRNPTAQIRHCRGPRPIWQRLTDIQISAAVAAASSPQARVAIALAAVYAARAGHIRALHLDDVDLADRTITIAGQTRRLDELTHRVLRDWLTHREGRWPHTANPHLLISAASAMRLGPVSAPFILDLRGLTATLERLRIDRQLEEAIASGGDPLHLAAVFGISTDTAVRYATNARQLIHDDHSAAAPNLLSTQAPAPDNGGDRHSGSR